MKKKAFICACAASLLIYNYANTSFVSAVDYSFIKKVESLQYDSEFQNEIAEEKAIRAGKNDTRWFDPEDQQKVYEIKTAQQLYGLAKLVNTRSIAWKVNEVYTFKGITIKLMNDIKLTKAWIPIGNAGAHTFEGTFDGNGHTVSGIKINGSANDNQGFFGSLSGTVKNLNLEGTIDTVGNNAGGLAANMAATAVAEDCQVNVEVTGNDKIGGVVGENNSGLILNCRNLGNVKGTVKVGGVVGENWNGIVDKCSNEGRVVSVGKGVGTYGTGGVAGRSVASSAMVKESYNKGNVYSLNECAGGVVGYTNADGSTIDSCYNTGSVSGPENGSYGYVGGVVGSIGENGVKLSNSYSAGVLKNGKYIGGVLGNYTADFFDDITTYVSNNYYLDSSAQAAVGKEKDNKGKRRYSKTAVYKSSGDMKSSAMAISLGSAYKADANGFHGINNGYPVLSWQEEVEIDRNEILDKMNLRYKKQFEDFFENYEYGTDSGAFIVKFFNPRVFFENTINDMEKHKK